MITKLKLSVNSKTDDISLFPNIKCECDKKNGKYSYSFYARKKLNGTWYIQYFYRTVEYHKSMRDMPRFTIEIDVINELIKPMLADARTFYESDSIARAIQLFDGRIINQIDENQED